MSFFDKVNKLSSNSQEEQLAMDNALAALNALNSMRLTGAEKESVDFTWGPSLTVMYYACAAVISNRASSKFENEECNGNWGHYRNFVLSKGAKAQHSANK